jgi:hypothetical protein
MKHTEDKLLSILTPAEQQKILRLKSVASPMEIVEAESGLNAWENSIQSTDKNLSRKLNNYSIEDSGSKDLHRLPLNKAKNIPPVRGVPTETSTYLGMKKNSTECIEESEDVSYRMRISGENIRWGVGAGRLEFLELYDITFIYISALIKIM